MNRVNYVAGREITSADLNAIQADVEAHLRSMAQYTLTGIVSGMAITGTRDGLQVAPGFGWDAQGRRLAIAAPTAVGVSNIVRPSAGNYRWVLVHGSYQSVERGTVADVARVTHPAYADDGAALGAAAGPEFAAANIAAARSSRTHRPRAPGGSVLIGYLIMDHASTWGTLAAGAERSPAPPPHQKVGDLMASLDVEVPDGWLRLDGSTVSRTEYPGLFRIIGTVVGPGDGTTTFTLPTAEIEGHGNLLSRYWLVRAG